MLKNIFYLNEQGKRKNLEDNIFPKSGAATPNDKLFLVCDGVGGLSKGEEASRIACEAIGHYFISKSIKMVTATVIDAAVAYALKEMDVYIVMHPEAQQMSTTLTLAFLQDNGVWTAWCGDSRIYHIRNGQILWQSKDHSLVQQLVEVGEISPEEAMHHPQKNVILRSLNANNGNTKIDTHFISNMQPEDYILLCTDGILENINPAAIKDILGTEQKEKNKQKLFLQYCAGKTNDNFSMYLLQLGKKKNGKSKLINYLLLMMLLIISAVISFMYFTKTNPNKHVDVKRELVDTNQNTKHKKTTDSGMIKMLEQHIGNVEKK